MSLARRPRCDRRRGRRHPLPDAAEESHNADRHDIQARPLHEPQPQVTAPNEPRSAPAMTDWATLFGLASAGQPSRWSRPACHVPRPSTRPRLFFGQQPAFPASPTTSTMTRRMPLRGRLEDGKRGETRCRGRLATVRRHRDSQQGFDSSSRQISGGIDRDSLYATHHFTSDELGSLLERQGFTDITVTTELEASSRRPDEAAYFLYATCRNGGRSPCTDASIWCSRDGDQEATTSMSTSWQAKSPTNRLVSAGGPSSDSPLHEEFRVNAEIRRLLQTRNRGIVRRLEQADRNPGTRSTRKGRRRSAAGKPVLCP
jgi:hypothetical protein